MLGSTLSFFHSSGFAAAPLASSGCGANGTIADESGFEDADGNLLIDKAGCMDWNGFAPATWVGTAPYQQTNKVSGNFTFLGVADAFDSNTDSSYAGGVKQADECPATGTGSVDNKTDIARIYVAASTDPVTKHVYLDLAWVRAPQNTTSSDVHIGFEFNQGKVPCGAGSPLMHRTKGDILLVYNFQSGSASIAYANWTGSAWTPEVTLAANLAEAQVFGGTSTADDVKPSNGINPATDEFGEAGIDLTAATSGLGNNGRACESFATVFGESRTSGSSTSAQMKDLVGPGNLDLSNCANPGLTTTQQPAAGAMGDTFKDKASISGLNTPDGTGTITFTLYSAADCGGSVLDTEAVSNINADGDYTTPNGFQLDNAGTYYWVASFSGDGYNNGKTTGCNDEPVVVAQALPLILTTQQPASGSVADTYKDTATLSQGVNYTGTGSLEFKLYSAADCGGSVIDDETVSNISANGEYSTPNGVQLNTAGTYYWVASFDGDANNASYTSGCNDEPVVVNPAAIKIAKTADHTQVNAGDQIGFTVTVYNTGAGNAYGVTMSDPLPKNDGLSWTIENQGAGWNNTCSITSGTLNCGPVTVPANTTKAGSSFTVHIVSDTTADTGGVCPDGSGVVNNTGSVTTTNDGSDEASASTCVAAPSIQIDKTADADQVNAGDQIGFTVTVYNTGSGDAYDVNLSDPLPKNDGLSWTIEHQGDGWNNTCLITLAGTLECGPVTVPAGTTEESSTFTVHIVSGTTADTGGVCPDGSGVVNNTGSVSTSNDGSDEASASTCVAAPSIKIDKTADAEQVNQGEQIGFTVTVYNDGTGDAYGVNLSDPLPKNTGLSWSIEHQGDGWNNTCSITVAGTLECGPVTVPAGTTEEASTFTVHIVSTTGPGSGGLCPETGVVDNTASVSTSNDGSGEASASTCIEGVTDLQITKSGSPASQDVPADKPYQDITWTMVVTNNGPDVDTNVQVADPIPAGTTYVSSDIDPADGTCTLDVPTSTLNCNLGTMQVGDSVTITMVTTPLPTDNGQLTNTAVVTGALPETTTENNTATASVFVTKEIRPPTFCTAVIVRPRQLYAGRRTTMHLTVINHHHVVQGVRVRITGPGIRVTTKPSNSAGKITKALTPKKAGIVLFKPLATKSCATPRIGITGVFTPPVTG